MKTHTHITRATLALALAAVLAVTSGCATMDTATQKVGGVFGSKSDTTKSATGGAILGCGAGAVLGKLMGKNVLAGCAVGAVAGGVASVQVHKHELAKARDLAAQAEATKGVTATVATKTVEAKDDQGNATATEALDRLTIDLPAKDVAAHASSIGTILVKAATLADGSADATTIGVEGTAAQRAWIVSQLRASLKAGSTVKVVEVAAASPRLVISPIPAKSAQASLVPSPWTGEGVAWQAPAVTDGNRTY